MCCILSKSPERDDSNGIDFIATVQHEDNTFANSYYFMLFQNDVAFCLNKHSQKLHHLKGLSYYILTILVS
jgi:hypothetical protein